VNSPVVRWLLVLLILVAMGVLAYGLLRLRPTAPRFSGSGAMENALDPQVAENGDVPGRDLRTVPRYLPSARIFFAEEPGQDALGSSYLVMYRCQGDLARVSAYYEREMPKQGWILIYKDEDILHMDFIRQGARELGPPMVQMDFRPVSQTETAVSILAMNAPGS
jgi:hypothetical protein